MDYSGLHLSLKNNQIWQMQQEQLNQTLSANVNNLQYENEQQDEKIKTLFEE